MKRKLRWFLYNGVAVTLAYLGVYGGRAWAWNWFMFASWVLAVFSTLLVFDDKVRREIREKGRVFPAWASVTIDICVVAGLATAGRFVTAGVWVWMMMIEQYTYAPDEPVADASQPQPTPAPPRPEQKLHP